MVRDRRGGLSWHRTSLRRFVAGVWVLAIGLQCRMNGIASVVARVSGNPCSWCPSHRTSRRTYPSLPTIPRGSRCRFSRRRTIVSFWTVSAGGLGDVLLSTPFAKDLPRIRGGRQLRIPPDPEEKVRERVENVRDGSARALNR